MRYGGPFARLQQSCWSRMCKNSISDGTTHAVIQISVEKVDPRKIELALGFKVACVKIEKLLLWGFTCAEHRQQFSDYMKKTYPRYEEEWAAPRNMLHALRKHKVHWFTDSGAHPPLDTSPEGIYFKY